MQLEKVCRDETIVLGLARVITIPTDVASVELPVKLFACDCPCNFDCDDYCDWVNDCCIYKVTAILSDGLGGTTDGFARVVNSTLSAVETCKNSCAKKLHHGKGY